MHLSKIVHAENKSTVCDVLESKHSLGAQLFHVCWDTTASDFSLAFHPIIFNALDGTAIWAAFLHTSVSAGPSGLDAYGYSGKIQLYLLAVTDRQQLRLLT